MNIAFPIDLLRTFFAVFETGSFTRAAQLRNLTQSAVSMQMKRLEENVGRPVFRKKGRTLQITPAGEVLLEHTRRILSAHDKAVAAFSRPELFGRVRFGCAEEYAARFLSTVLAGFRKSFPCIRVDIHSAPGIELFRRLKNKDLDLCLLESNSENDGPKGESAPMAASETVVCHHLAAEGGRLIHREPVVWVTSRTGAAHEENPLPLAVYHQGCVYRQWAEEGLRQMGRQYWIAFVSPSISSILAAVRAGLAVAPVGTGSVDETLCILGPEAGFPTLPVSEIRLYQAGCVENEPVSCFADYVAEAFRRASRSAAPAAV